ncbi:hypothetical protein D3C71_1995050 [compost metagenome]
MTKSKDEVKKAALAAEAKKNADRAAALAIKNAPVAEEVVEEEVAAEEVAEETPATEEAPAAEENKEEQA